MRKRDIYGVIPTQGICKLKYEKSSPRVRNCLNDQAREVANPACGQLAEQGKSILPCPRSRLRIGSRETGLAVPSRVSLLISILKLNMVLTYGIPPEFRGAASIYTLSLCIMYYGCSSTCTCTYNKYHDISSTVITVCQFDQ